jgi:hypothetical protein
MVAVPAEMPPSIPVPIKLAMEGLLLSQNPPAIELDIVIVDPAQTLSVPEMTVGSSLTVTITELNPQEVIYDITAVPAVNPVTTPDALIVATDKFALLQLPPLVVFAKVTVAPSHTSKSPRIAAGTPLIVNISVW